MYFSYGDGSSVAFEGNDYLLFKQAEIVKVLTGISVGDDSVGFASLTINEKKLSKYFTTVNNYFTRLNILNYRRLANIGVKHLSRVNIFAGANNSGKTSMLEAFYILSQLNDLNAYFNMDI